MEGSASIASNSSPCWSTYPMERIAESSSREVGRASASAANSESRNIEKVGLFWMRRRHLYAREQLSRSTRPTSASSGVTSHTSPSATGRDDCRYAPVRGSKQSTVVVGPARIREIDLAFLGGQRRSTFEALASGRTVHPSREAEGRCNHARDHAADDDCFELRRTSIIDRGATSASVPRIAWPRWPIRSRSAIVCAFLSSASIRSAADSSAPFGRPTHRK